MIKMLNMHTMWPGSIVPFNIVTYYIKWVTTSWTHNMSDPEIPENCQYIKQGKKINLWLVYIHKVGKLYFYSYFI